MQQPGTIITGTWNQREAELILIESYYLIWDICNRAWMQTQSVKRMGRIFMGYWGVILIGVMGGLAVGVQAQIAGAMGQRVGGVSSSFIIHLSGMVFSGIYLFIRGGEKIQEWHTLPWYMLGAGIFGLILYLSINTTLPRLGGTMMITLIISGQLLAGLIMDQFGFFGMDIRQIDTTRAAGVVALLVGSFLIAK